MDKGNAINDILVIAKRRPKDGIEAPEGGKTEIRNIILPCRQHACVRESLGVDGRKVGPQSFASLAMDLEFEPGDDVLR